MSVKLSIERKEENTHWDLKMAIISTTSGFAVDKIGWVPGVSDTTLKRGSGRCQSNGCEGEDGEDGRSGEFHCSCDVVITLRVRILC